tara:strand:- start:69 stop:1373 length:1305 start_codon:yes stop_codon:yes gene_type:complete
MPLYNRKDMPQVNTQKLGKAIDMVKSKVKVTKTRILATKLKESQVELIPKKVKGIAAKYDKPTDMKPLIVSKDNYIVDGHHRWAAGIYKFGKGVKLPVYIIQLNRVNAIKLYQSIAKSLNEDINVPISVGDTVLGGKFKNKRIIVKSIGKNEKGDITINNKPLLKFRILPKLKEESIGAKIECGNCGWDWRVEDGGDDLYICHKCGNDNEAQETHATPSTDNKKTAGLPVIRRDGASNLNNSGQYSKVTEKKKPKKKKSKKASLMKQKRNFYLKPDNAQKELEKSGKEGQVLSRKVGKQRVYFVSYVGNAGTQNIFTEIYLSEIPMGDLKQIDTFADKKLNPVDVVLTDKHFFDRLNDPRNKKEISKAELIGFFKRLAKKKKTFLDFLDKYNQVVAVDDRTDINIPFMKQANKVIAKTVMRKKDFKTQNQKVEI